MTSLGHADLPSFLPSHLSSLLFRSFFPSATGARTHAPQLNFPTPFCLRRYTTFATKYSCKERSKFGLLKCLVCLKFFFNCLKLLQLYIQAFKVRSSLRQKEKNISECPSKYITTDSGYMLQWLGKACLPSAHHSYRKAGFGFLKCLQLFQAQKIYISDEKPQHEQKT